ncbi:MAG: hypothetical protein WKF88_07335 [Ferruginibacter sp.]
MSDHGFPEIDQKHFNNILAVRMPHTEKPPFRNYLTNVNFFRDLFNIQYGQNFSYLPDSTIALHMKSIKK